MSVQTLVGPTSHEGFKFNFLPLLPIALSVFCLSGLAFYHVELSGTGMSSGVFQALVVGLYQILGFVPSFMLFLLVLSWASIWFITGALAEPGSRLGRLLLLTLALSVLVNLQPEVGPPAPHSGAIGHFLASRLESLFGYTLSTLLVAPLALVSLLLATDFFFYRYFETLGRQMPESVGGKEYGVEKEATETLKSLRFSESPSTEPDTGPVHGAMPEPVELVVAEEAPAPAFRGARRVVLDVDEEIPWEPEDPVATAEQPGAGVGHAVEDAVTGDEAEQEPEEVLDEGEEEVESEEEEWDEEAEDGEEPEEEEYEEEEYEEEEYEEEEYDEEEEDDDVEEDEEYDEEEEDIDLSAEEEEDEEDEEEEEEDEEAIDLSLDDMEGLEEPEERVSRRRRRAPTRLGEGEDTTQGSGEGEQLIMFLDEDEPEPGRGENREEKVTLIPRPTGAPGLVEEAKQLVLGSGRVSATFLQRRLRVDFDEAMHLLRALRVQGVIRIGDNETHGSLV